MLGKLIVAYLLALAVWSTSAYTPTAITSTQKRDPAPDCMGYLDRRGFDVDFADEISGEVRYTNTGEFIEGMRVELCTANWKRVIRTTKSNQKGEFRFPSVPDGEYFIRYRKKGYCGDKLKVVVTQKCKQQLTLITEGGC